MSILRNHPSVQESLRLTFHKANKSRQIRPSPLSPQRLPLRHGLLVNFERGGGLEASDYDQANSSRRPRSPRRPQPRFSSPSRCIQFIQEGPSGIREQGQADCSGEPSSLGGRSQIRTLSDPECIFRLRRLVVHGHGDFSIGVGKDCLWIYDLLIAAKTFQRFF
jgi:hypothetical protein